MDNKVKKAYEDYAALRISFEIFEHMVRSYLKFSKERSDDEKKFSIDYLPSAHKLKFCTNVPTEIIANVLKRYLENEINIKELENWANVLLMDDDHFVIADDEPSTRRDFATDALHQIANWPESLPRLDIVEGARHLRK